MSFEAGSIISKMGLDMSPFARGMFQASSIAQLFPATVTNFLASPLLGIIGVARDAANAISSAFTSIGRAADDAGEAAERVGVSVQFLTSVGAVAKDSGSSVQGLADSLRFLNNNAADAASNMKGSTAAAFRDLGVSVVDAGGKIKPAEDLFFEVADAIAGLDSTAKQTQASLNIFGRGGSEIIPLLRQGKSGIQEFAAEITQLGGSIDSRTAEMGDQFGKLSTYVDAAIFGIKQAAAQPILAVLSAHFGDAKQGIISIAGAIRAGVSASVGSLFSFIQSHGQRIANAARLAASAAQQAFGFLSSAIRVASGIFSRHSVEIVGALKGMAVAFAAFNVASFVTGIGAAGSVLGLLKGVVLGVVGVLGAPVAIFVAIGAAVGALLAHLGLLTPAWNAVKAATSSAVTWIQSTAIPVIGQGLATAFQYVKPAAMIAVGAALSLWSNLKGFVGFINATVVPVIVSGFGAAMSFLRPIFASVGKGIVSMFPLFTALWNIAKVVGGVLVAVFKVVGNVLSTVFVTAFRVASPVLRFFGNIIGWVIEKLTSFLGWIGKAINKVLEFFGLGADAGGGGSSAPTLQVASAAAGASPAPGLNAAADAVADSAVNTSSFTGSVKDAADEFDQLRPNVSNVSEAFNGAGDAIDNFTVSANAMADRADSILQGSAGGASSTAGQSSQPVQIVMNPTISFDAEKASSQLAAQLEPVMRQALRQLESKLAAQRQADLSRGGS